MSVIQHVQSPKRFNKVHEAVSMIELMYMYLDIMFQTEILINKINK